MFCCRRKDINGQLALVTGGASGIGREIVFALAGVGCNVAIVDIDGDQAERTAKDLTARFPSVAVDVSNFDEIRELKEKIATDLGPVDILINNAAILFEAPLLEEHPEHFRRMINVNVLACLWTTRVFLPSMIERKQGHLVTLASAAGLYGPPHMLMYVTSKFALRGFMEALQCDLHVQGHAKYIKTSTIYPFFVNSSKMSANFAKDFMKASKILQPLSPEKVAKRIVEAILREEKVVTIPWYHKFLGYYVNGPPWMRNMTFSKITNSK